jgi:hypothetical protein
VLYVAGSVYLVSFASVLTVCSDITRQGKSSHQSGHYKQSSFSISVAYNDEE